MPAVRNSSEAKESGVYSIISFVGRLRVVDEDVDGGFENVQVCFRFQDVTVLKTDGFRPDDGNLAAYMTQGEKKSTKYIKSLTQIEAFIGANKLEGEWVEPLYEKLIQYDRVEVILGRPDKGISPGYAFIPVKLVDEATFDPGEYNGAEEDTTEYEVPSDELMEAIREMLAAESLTSSLIMKELRGSAPMRNAVASCGNIDRVLTYMTGDHGLVNNDGVFSRA